MDQGRTLRGWIGGMIICLLMASSAFGQPKAPLPRICHGLEVLQPISPLKDFEIYSIIGTIGLGELRRRINQGLNRMACAQLMILREMTLERRLPYEQARQQAAEAVQEALSILHSLATPEEKPLLSTLNRAYQAFRPLNAAAASLALLAETPAEVETAKALSDDKARVAFDAVMAAWQPYRVRLIPEHVDDGWETASLASVGMDAAIIEAITGRIQKFSIYKYIDSLVIVRHGKLVYEHYFNGYQPAEEHRLYSVTKSIASLLTGVAIFQGFLTSEDMPVRPFFPDYPQGPALARHWEALTLKHLLTMTAGLGCGGAEKGVRTSADDEACLMAMFPTDDWLQYVLKRPVASPPGRQLTYDTSSLIALSRVLTQASGMSIAELATRYLYQPLGIAASRWWRSPKGLVLLGLGHWLRPRDMAKLGELVLRGGVWKGKRVLSKAWITASTRQHMPVNLGDASGYGYLWWQLTLMGQEVDITVNQARGYGGQFIFVVPSFDLVVVFTGSQYPDQGFLSSKAIEFLKRDILDAVQ